MSQGTPAPHPGAEIAEGSVREFLDRLAAASAAPGGGAAAALAGAMGAALVSMACRLTSGRARFAAVEEEVRDILDQAERLRGRLMELADSDRRAFDQVMAAYRLPKETQAQREERHEAVQAALKEATRVPLEIAEACAHVIRLAGQAISLVNPNARSDMSVGALLADAGLQGARLNIHINLSGVEDRAFVREKRQALDRLLADVAPERQKALSYLRERTGGPLSPPPQ